MKKILVLAFLIIAIVILFNGCGRDIYEIKSNETAFLIPLTGDSVNGQSTFESAQFLDEKKVAGKRVIIEKELIWGTNYPTHRLVKIDRTNVTREWTEVEGTGTSNANEGIIAESNEGIGFMARFSCTAWIAEEDASQFLYKYPSNKKLSEVMDKEIRTLIEGLFVKECSKVSLEDIIKTKSDIAEKVKEQVVTHFKEEGITISALNLKGELTYLDPGIQKAINAAFSAEKKKTAQTTINQMNKEKAEADAKVVKLQSETLEKSLKLLQLENQKAAIEKWDGKMPQYSGGNSASFFGIPLK